jgi:hypothetical protein
MDEASPKSHSTAVAAEAENAQGGAEAKITFSRPRYIVTLTWKAIPDGEEFYMILARSGPKETITAFIEEWLLKFPDPDLMTEALEKCNGKLPENIRLF